MAANVLYFVTLREAALADAEYAFLKLYGREITDEASGETLIVLSCTRFEPGDYMAKLGVIDPHANDVIYDWWLPMQLILMVDGGPTSNWLRAGGGRLRNANLSCSNGASQTRVE